MPLKSYSLSKNLICSTKNFFRLDYYFFFYRLLDLGGIFYGWGRKKSGQKAVALAKKQKTSFVLLEDGFIRSIGLGSDKGFSIVEDDIGIMMDTGGQVITIY